jgi:tetratricopeptide (TPR) repeat protein
MRRGACLILVAALVAGTPALSQMSGTGVPPNSGQDPNYDDMRADMDAKQNAKTADEFVTGAALVKQQQFGAAIPHLEAALVKKPHDVTLLIYLGFAHRMLGGAATGDAQKAEFKKALDCYQQALAVNGDNKLLHEYLGKLYLLMRDYDLAATEMKSLDSLCPSGCAERDALKLALAANPPPPGYVPTTPHH